MGTGLESVAKKHFVVGFVAAGVMLAAYAAVLFLAQGREHLFEQSARIWYWLLALAAGFGIQAGLFSFIRQTSKQRRKGTTACVATSGTVSAGSMAACCAHHLADVLPLLGMSAATAFLVSYQTWFMAAGLIANLAGIAVMLRTIRRLDLAPTLTRRRQWNMAWLRRGA